MTTARALVRPSMCREQLCTAAILHPEHHDRLLRVDVDLDQALDLLEIAVTWQELDYSGASMIGPSAWLTFAAEHRWKVPGRAERLFSLAVDIVGRQAAGAPPAGDLATVIELVRA